MIIYIGCGDCIDACGVSAIYLRHAYVNDIYNRSLAIIHSDQCISCGDCVPVCQWEALTLAEHYDNTVPEGSDVNYTIAPNSNPSIEEAFAISNKDFEDDPPCFPIYKDIAYTSTADLMVDILIDNTCEQLGITDIAAAMAILSGANIIGSRGKFAGATPGTSIASKYISALIPGTSPAR